MCPKAKIVYLPHYEAKVMFLIVGTFELMSLSKKVMSLYCTVDKQQKALATHIGGCVNDLNSCLSFASAFLLYVIQ